jgi:hypothetical protein
MIDSNVDDRHLLLLWLIGGPTKTSYQGRLALAYLTNAERTATTSTTVAPSLTQFQAVAGLFSPGIISPLSRRRVNKHRLFSF